MERTRIITALQDLGFGTIKIPVEIRDLILEQLVQDVDNPYLLLLSRRNLEQRSAEVIGPVNFDTTEIEESVAQSLLKHKVIDLHVDFAKGTRPATINCPFDVSLSEMAKTVRRLTVTVFISRSTRVYANELYAAQKEIPHLMDWLPALKELYLTIGKSQPRNGYGMRSRQDAEDFQANALSMRDYWAELGKLMAATIQLKCTKHIRCLLEEDDVQSRFDYKMINEAHTTTDASVVLAEAITEGYTNGWTSVKSGGVDASASEEEKAERLAGAYVHFCKVMH